MSESASLAPATAGAPSIRSYEERAVLAKYATGANLHDITDPHGHDWVADLVMRVTGMDRGRARAAVLAWDARMSSQGGRRTQETPAAAKPAPVKVAAASKPAVEKRVIEAVKTVPPTTTEPAPEPQPPRELVMPDDIRALLKDAEQSGLTRAVEKADRIRYHIHELNEMMANSEKERVLRATIRVLTEQRNKAIEELKELTGKPDVRVSDEPMTAEQRGEIRRWAAANGHVVAGNGRIQRDVIAAWKEATR